MRDAIMRFALCVNTTPVDICITTVDVCITLNHYLNARVQESTENT